MLTALLMLVALSLTICGGSALASTVHSVSGHVFIDTNQNGILNTGEKPLANVLVSLYDANGKLLGSRHSDANGLYTFSNIVANTYKVVETIPSPYTNTSPSSVVVKLTSLTGVLTVNFGDVNLVHSISGNLFIDANKNGKIDVGEKPLAYTHVALYDCNGNLLGLRTTNATGYYSFLNLWIGSYKLVATVPTGYVNTTPATVVSRLYPSTGMLTVNFGDALCAPVTPTPTLTVTPTPIPTANATIVGLKYYDTNKNGKYDSGEVGLSNWTIKLNDPQTQLTSSGGNFIFSVKPGTYIISEVLQPGYINTSPSSMMITVTAGEVLNVTSSYGLFGNVLQTPTPTPTVTPTPTPTANATIVGLKYYDTNKNGKYDSGEVGLPNWTIKLNDPQTQLTSTGGNFNFSVLPGSYIISEVLQPGYTNTSPTSKVVTVTAGEVLNVTTAYGLFGNILTPTPTPTPTPLHRRYSDTDTDTDCTYCYSDTNTDCYSDTNTYCYTNTYTDTDTTHQRPLFPDLR